MNVAAVLRNAAAVHGLTFAPDPATQIEGLAGGRTLHGAELAALSLESER
jgi:hypothetical protein